MKTYQELATLIQARANCAQSGNDEWFDKHTEKAERICKDRLPRGSGFDAGTHIDWDKSAVDKIVLRADFHHMDDNGFYCGWSEHDVIVTPSLAFGFDLRVTGRNVRDIKDYILDTFYHALNEDCVVTT